MKKILNWFIRLTGKILGKNNLTKAIIYVAKVQNVNLLQHGLIQNGALNGYYHQILSEEFFVSKILPSFFKQNNNPIFFDVGANVGNYASDLISNFPKSIIYSFEPVNTTYEKLEENTKGKRINIYNLGFSDHVGVGLIHNVINSENTEIASIYKDVFEGIYENNGKIETTEFRMDTIDNFCQINNIPHLDFLKIDVEGHELSVLKGAIDMLSKSQVSIIQFEFNTHNIYSGTFLKDFYSLLENFDFYRLLRNGLFKLGPYDPLNEIFILQNIIAIRKDLDHLIDTTYIYAL